MNRRNAISALGGATLAAREVLAQQAPPETNPAPQVPPPVASRRLTPEAEAAREKARTRPSLCVYSGCLSKIPYQQLSEIVGQMGYDGVDLTVMQGGHVDPSRYMVDLDRAFQTFQDAGIELPMVTTNFTSPSAPYAYAILYVSGQLGARFCRLGTWPSLPVVETTGPNTPASQFVQMRAMMMRNDLAQFSATGRQCNITPLLANHAGSFPGRSIPEAEAMLAGVAPKLFGYCFDPVQAVIESRSANAWEGALQAALPRLAAVALSDVALSGGAPSGANADTTAGSPVKPRACPLGEGVIDWKKFFSMLAGAHFHGPISLHMDYETPNGINSMRKDLAFARARVEEAWPLS